LKRPYQILVHLEQYTQIRCHLIFGIRLKLVDSCGYDQRDKTDIAILRTQKCFV